MSYCESPALGDCVPQHAQETICGGAAPSAGWLQTHREAQTPPEAPPSAPGCSHYDALKSKKRETRERAAFLFLVRTKSERESFKNQKHLQTVQRDSAPQRQTPNKDKNRSCRLFLLDPEVTLFCAARAPCTTPSSRHERERVCE